ncbi:MAG: Clp protease N-terminal domain-containing protein [Acidimicrobiales bacterium]
MTTRAHAPDPDHPWTTYICAREEARVRGDRRVGTEHLVLGLLHEPLIGSLLGVDLPRARAALDALDRDALGAIGVRAHLGAPPLPTFEPPPRPTPKAVWQGRLSLTPAAKVALQEAGKPIRRGRQITAPEVLLRLLEREPPDPGAALFAALDVDRARLRVGLITRPSAS